jgi:hypothetical protein
MEIQSLPPNSLPRWKRLGVISLFAGAGFSLTAGLLLGLHAWYASRPKPAKPWNTIAIVAKERPRFNVSDDGKKVEFHYVLENAEDKDYRVDSFSNVEMLLQQGDGTLSRPLPGVDKLLSLPIFIPARQKARMSFSIPFAGIPTRDPAESDAAFHQRIRNYLEQGYGSLRGFVIFDNTNRYQIELPKWFAEAPKEQTR